MTNSEWNELFDLMRAVLNQQGAGWNEVAADVIAKAKERGMYQHLEDFIGLFDGDTSESVM